MKIISTPRGFGKTTGLCYLAKRERDRLKKEGVENPKILIIFSNIQTLYKITGHNYDSYSGVKNYGQIIYDEDNIDTVCFGYKKFIDEHGKTVTDEEIQNYDEIMVDNLAYFVSQMLGHSVDYATISEE